MKPRTLRDLSERFWEKVKIGAPDDCWEWQGCIDPTGYGKFWRDGRRYRAHRVAYELTHGSIPDGKSICHTCDNRRCCNPNHLWAGTYAENNTDRHLKNRDNNPKGDRSKHHKLTEANVRQIWAMYNAGGIQVKQIAIHFGVTRNAASEIIHGRCWTCVQH